ncbi:MAG: tRNA (adenosine(37)-N6)-threonylcarbamoyltransferase complex ATPase subunit type 1 TsaE [Acidimicrobiia bacterium]|nr:tRNA (adenosine(37)-N6)-threonylcarbamoyltransferase complex ATPase subunit type 1 TsaE [Acidimicrobiia bacterium]
MSITFATSHPDETRTLGRKLAALLTAGDVVVLSGRLGSGKTLFVSGIAEGLGIGARITSPTFLIAKSYVDGFLPLIHADVYRLGSVTEFDDLGLLDSGADGAVVIEWGEAVAEALPKDRLIVSFTMAGDERTIAFQPVGGWVERDLGVLA